VAFFQDLSLDDSAELVSPSFRALELALQEERVGGVTLAVVPFDTHGDPGAALTFARQVVADPSYVEVVVAPFWSPSPQVQDVFAAGGIPVISLSASDGPPGSGGVWRRLVVGETAQSSWFAATLDARAPPGTEVCLGGDGSVLASSLQALVATSVTRTTMGFTATTGDSGALATAISHIRAAGCRSVGWTGFPDGARALRDGLTAAELSRVTIVGSDAMKVRSYLSGTAGAEGTLVTCPCADVTTSADPAAQRMVHDYQSATGREPGAYAAEGWDVAHLLLGVIERGARTKADVRAAVATMTEVSGIAGPYRFAGDGSVDTVDPRVYRAEGLRWIATSRNG
jgi:branched-chain amino acid transport system substrate-binding protein